MCALVSGLIPELDGAPGRIYGLPQVISGSLAPHPAGFGGGVFGANPHIVVLESRVELLQRKLIGCRYRLVLPPADAHPEHAGCSCHSRSFFSPFEGIHGAEQLAIIT